jgi:hypothetical protein
MTQDNDAVARAAMLHTGRMTSKLAVFVALVVFGLVVILVQLLAHG